MAAFAVIYVLAVENNWAFDAPVEVDCLLAPKPR
jgi:hypothetical protein